jgi:hypothetical protein
MTTTDRFPEAEHYTVPLERVSSPPRMPADRRIDAIASFLASPHPDGACIEEAPLLCCKK